MLFDYYCEIHEGNIGVAGECLARSFLTARSYYIKEVNHTTTFGEIDIVAEYKGITVFVEVKTRASLRYGSPLQAITENKKQRIIRNSLSYMKMNKIYEKPARIDIIGIILDKDKNFQLISHLRNAIELDPEFK